MGPPPRVVACRSACHSTPRTLWAQSQRLASARGDESRPRAAPSRRDVQIWRLVRRRRRAGGNLPPARRASDTPIAMACLRLVTFFPEPPERSVPCFISLSSCGGATGRTPRGGAWERSCAGAATRLSRFCSSGSVDGLSSVPNLQQCSEFLGGTQVGLGRLLFRVPGVLPVEAERGGCLPSEPLEVLLLGP